MRFWNKYNGDLLYETCEKQFKKNKDFEASLNLPKRQALHEFGYMLP